MNTILLVEDDETLRITLQDNLEEEGYRVYAVPDGEKALACLDKSPIDMMILDIMLPDTNGYALCRHIRNAGQTLPILMLTARTLEDDLVRGLDAGADDYLAKPYRLGELLARVRALLRRRGSQKASHDRIKMGALIYDRAGRQVLDGTGSPIDLTPKEFQLLGTLLTHVDQALSRQAILDAVWGRDVVVTERTIDNFISSLKKKLNARSPSGVRISAVRGFGYRLALDED